MIFLEVKDRLCDIGLFNDKQKSSADIWQFYFLEWALLSSFLLFAVWAQWLELELQQPSGNLTEKVRDLQRRLWLLKVWEQC